jgi:hypothetical protein
MSKDSLNDKSSMQEPLTLSLAFERPRTLSEQDEHLGQFSIRLINNGPYEYLCLVNTWDMLSSFSMTSELDDTPVYADIRHVMSTVRPKPLTEQDYKVLKAGEHLSLGVIQLRAFAGEARKDIHVSCGNIIVSNLRATTYKACLRFLVGGYECDITNNILKSRPSIKPQTVSVQKLFDINIPKQSDYID